MNDVVPSALQRLSAADIIRVAGLTVASLGQEYARIRAVHTTMRQGARLFGIVDVTGDIDDDASRSRECAVDIEIQTTNVWLTTCSCHADPTTVCEHAAALLYHWLANPWDFATSSPVPITISSLKNEGAGQPPGEQRRSVAMSQKSLRPLGKSGYAVVERSPTLPGNFSEILAQLALSELRGIAREYDISPQGLNKQQLSDSILAVLKQPEVIRRVVGTLEKVPRQLLATLTLAGGAIPDEDLRSLFERFSFGKTDKLQSVLVTLQSKGLLFRINFNSSLQQRVGLGSSLLDIGWYVPLEVRAALRVTVPTTAFDVQKVQDGDTGVPALQQAEPYSLLANLLLVARALDGYRLEHDDEKDERNIAQRSLHPLAAMRNTNAFANDGMGNVPAPSGMPSSSLIEALQTIVPRTPTFLRFAARLLRLADILHKDDSGTPYLRVLPNAAQLLLGPAHTEVARDLFELWLTRASYEELYDLQEEGLRLRCRTTPLNHPILRPGELEAENNEARQALISIVAQAPLNQWINFSAFERFIYRLNPLFLQKRQRLFPTPHWWLEPAEGQALQPTQSSDWMRAEGRYLARLLREPLHWWGINDLALSNDGRLLAFRLTPLAGWLLQGISLDAETSERNYTGTSPLLEVLETGEVLIACSAAAWPLIALIEDFAEVAGVRNGRLCYRLAPKTISEALSRGKYPTTLLERLHQIVENESAPDSNLVRMLAQLESWAANYGKVRLYTGVSLLEVADTLVLRELTATTSVEEEIVQAISPTLVILKKQGMGRFVEELKRRGQAPLLHEKDYYGTE